MGKKGKTATHAAVCGFNRWGKHWHANCLQIAQYIQKLLLSFSINIIVQFRHLSQPDKRPIFALGLLYYSPSDIKKPRLKPGLKRSYAFFFFLRAVLTQGGTISPISAPYEKASLTAEELKNAYSGRHGKNTVSTRG